MGDRNVRDLIEPTVQVLNRAGLDLEQVKLDQHLRSVPRMFGWIGRQTLHALERSSYRRLEVCERCAVPWDYPPDVQARQHLQRPPHVIEARFAHELRKDDAK